MAVLVEAISIIIRRETIDEKYPGGVDQYIKDSPNGTFCMDEEITRVGFMSPDDVDAFIENLELLEFRCVNDGQYEEIAVVEQLRGFTLPCEWLEILDVTLFEGNQKFRVCQIKGSALSGVFCPHGWNYETSLSKRVVMVETDKMDERMVFLRQENEWDVYRDKVTGKELYIKRQRRRHLNA